MWHVKYPNECYNVLDMELTPYLFPFLLVVLGVMLLIFSLISRRLKEISEAQKPDESLLKYFKHDLIELKSSIDQTKDTMNNTLLMSNKNLTDSLQKSQKEIHDRLSRAAEVIGELKREAGAFTEVSRSMKELQEFLSSPKLRGNIGEAVLNELISEILPKNSYSFQHTFRSGSKVDAAIKTAAGLITIDSKFSMENFQKMTSASGKEREEFRKSFVRDTRKHIRDISAKYILPEEGTLDFSLMYIPSESVYYEIASSPELIDYARSMRVFPVSPTLLHIHLHNILLSLEGKEIERKAREVFKLLRALEKDYEKSGQSLGTLGAHLTNAYNKFADVQTNFHTLGQKLSSTKQLTGQIEEQNLIEE